MKGPRANLEVPSRVLSHPPIFLGITTKPSTEMRKNRRESNVPPVGAKAIKLHRHGETVTMH